MSRYTVDLRELRRPRKGGEFHIERPLLRLGRLVLFRPDEQTHSVDMVEQGERWVLSLGWCRDRPVL